MVAFFQREFLLACCSSLIPGPPFCCNSSDKLNRPATDTIIFHYSVQREADKTHCCKLGLLARVICKGQHCRSLQFLPGTLARKKFVAFSYFSSSAQALLSHFDTSWRIHFKNHKAQVLRTSIFSLYPQKIFASLFFWQVLNSPSNSPFKFIVWLWARYVSSFPCSSYISLFCLIIHKAGIVFHYVLMVPRSSGALISQTGAFGYFPNIRYLLLSASVSLAHKFHSLVRPSRREKESDVSSKE